MLRRVLIDIPSNGFVEEGRQKPELGDLLLTTRDLTEADKNSQLYSNHT
jgi:hypothetical protein